jgi:hypothetical protein
MLLLQKTVTEYESKFGELKTELLETKATHGEDTIGFEDRK